MRDNRSSRGLGRPRAPSYESAMDFPAAHSMDTRWFAVDDDGCVAAFDSGETGCVPEDWKGGQDKGYTLAERLLALGLPMDLSRRAGLPPSREVRLFERDREPA